MTYDMIHLISYHILIYVYPVTYLSCLCNMFPYKSAFLGAACAIDYYAILRPECAPRDGCEPCGSHCELTVVCNRLASR